jgi:hypothetical protein
MPSRPTPDPDQDVGDRLRADWELVKREGRLAGEQVRDGLRRLWEALR